MKTLKRLYTPEDSYVRVGEPASWWDETARKVIQGHVASLETGEDGFPCGALLVEGPWTPPPKTYHYVVEDFGGVQTGRAYFVTKAAALRAFHATPLPMGTGRFLTQGNYFAQGGGAPQSRGEEYILAEGIGGSFEEAGGSFLAYYH